MSMHLSWEKKKKSKSVNNKAQFLNVLRKNTEQYSPTLSFPAVFPAPLPPFLARFKETLLRASCTGVSTCEYRISVASLLNAWQLLTRIENKNTRWHDLHALKCIFASGDLGNKQIPCQVNWFCASDVCGRDTTFWACFYIGLSESCFGNRSGAHHGVSWLKAGRNWITTPICLCATEPVPVQHLEWSCSCLSNWWDLELLRHLCFFRSQSIHHM